MENFDPATSFGKEVADRYDEVSHLGDEDATVDFLRQLRSSFNKLERH
jgi:hypothetical protein